MLPEKSVNNVRQFVLIRFDSRFNFACMLVYETINDSKIDQNKKGFQKSLQSNTFSIFSWGFAQVWYL